MIQLWSNSELVKKKNPKANSYILSLVDIETAGIVCSM